MHTLLNVFEHKHFVYFITAVITYGVAGLVTNVIRTLLDKYFHQASLSSKVDPTRYAFAKNAVSLIVFILATVFVFSRIPSLRTIGLTLFASAGIFAAIIGFAAQAAFANVFSGIFIVIYKPFRVEDNIMVGKDYEGIVEDITLRHTVIRNYENRRIVVPNSVISAAVITNSTLDERLCMHVHFHVAFGTDVDKALTIIREIAEKHPLVLDNRTLEEKEQGKEKVKTRLIELEDHGARLRAWVWTHDPSTGFEAKCDILKSVKERFDQEGIQLAERNKN